MSTEKNVEKINKLAAKKKTQKIIDYMKSKDKTTRLAAIKALGASGGEEAFNQLVSMLNSTEADERAAAALALGELGIERGSSFLSHRLLSENDANASAAIREAMKMIRAR